MNLPARKRGQTRAAIRGEFDAGHKFTLPRNPPSLNLTPVALSMQALRLVRPRGTLQPLLRLSTAAAPPPSSSSSRARSASVIPLSNVEAQWETLSADEKLEVHNALEELQKKDWKLLSLDEKKAGESPCAPRS